MAQEPTITTKENLTRSYQATASVVDRTVLPEAGSTAMDQFLRIAQRCREEARALRHA